MLHAEPIPGSPTLFFVESESLECDGCKRILSPRNKNNLEAMVGAPCGECSGVVRRCEPYQVDISLYGGIGKCPCTSWNVNIGPVLKTMPPAMRHKVRDGLEFRCKHVTAALIKYAMLELDTHQAQQRVNAPAGSMQEDGE